MEIYLGLLILIQKEKIKIEKSQFQNGTSFFNVCYDPHVLEKWQKIVAIEKKPKVSADIAENPRANMFLNFN